MSVRTTTTLAAQTVTDVSTGEVPLPDKRRPDRRPIGGTWNSPLARDQVPDRLLQAAIKTAGGDTTRLWFGDDGAVWILNHQRGTKCPSPACPACHPTK